MAQSKVKQKRQEKTERPLQRGQHPTNQSESGVPSRGGSRQGNVGHESNQASDEAHR